MTLSRFQELVADEFGASFSQVVLSDTRLTSHQDLTPLQLLERGVDPKEIWHAICVQLEVPVERRQGKNKTKRHAE
ncbi:MAG: DUF3046 domain-containing protein [Aquiluna sp.]